MDQSIGARLTARQLVSTLEHIFAANADAEKAGGRPTPVCVWGLHGIGKTMIVEELARSRGWRFAFLSPAQFEEMGDLNGLPVLTDDGRTAFAPPRWVPADEGPGILLIDDINRADDRILRGLMQLLSEFRLSSWALPPRWQIVATANPEGGGYSVTPMDEAILSRMMHLTLEFDAAAWAGWARRNGVDARGVDFVLGYPEVVAGLRTTPRSLTQFFRAVAAIPDLAEQLETVRILGLSTLDDATVAAFLSYVTESATVQLTPAEVLDADDWQPVAAKLSTLAGRVDQLSLLCARLVGQLTAEGYAPGPRHAENLVRFMTGSELPRDLMAGLHRDLVTDGPPEVRAMVRDKRIATALLSVL